MLVRLRREIQVLRSLNNPNIIGLHEIFEEHGSLYMVMELATGGELWHFLQRVEVTHHTPARTPTLHACMHALPILLGPIVNFSRHWPTLFSRVHRRFIRMGKSITRRRMEGYP